MQFSDPSFSVLDHVSFSEHNTDLPLVLNSNISTNLPWSLAIPSLVVLEGSGIKTLPPIDLSLSFTTIKTQLINILWSHFHLSF